MKHSFATCKNENCERKHSCYRYTVKDKQDETVHFDEIDCVFYWGLNNKPFYPELN